MKSENSKQKLLLILEWMRKTDENHPLNATQIIAKLEEEGITAERRSISRDITCLKEYGYDILLHENHNLGWYMVGQEFEDHEIKMLVDAVATAKFLTIEDSRALIKKLKSLATKDCEKLIDATLVMDQQLKLDDKKFTQKFDTIMRAITNRNQISFQYYELKSGNKKVLRRDGHVYQVSPYFLALSRDEYFLICNTSSHNHVTYFRVEKMVNLQSLEDQSIRPMHEIEELKDIGHTKTMADFLRESVNMWDGKTSTVSLRAQNNRRLDVIKKFGRNIFIRDDGDNEFIAQVRVANSEGFYYWLASYGPFITILEPEDMRNEYIEFLKKSLNNYQ